MWPTTIQQNPSETVVATVEDCMIGFASFGQYREREADRCMAEIRAIYLLDPAGVKEWVLGFGSIQLKR